MPLSRHALQTLLGYVVERRAVLYGGVVCAYDMMLLAMLSVPLVEPLPSLAASPRSMHVVVKLDEKVMVQSVAVCEVEEIVEKGLDAAELRMEDMVLLSEAIVLVVLEEREEVEGEEKGEEKGGRKGGDGNEEKGGYPTAHREFVERIKENQGKLEEAMAPLVVEVLGTSRLRFAKARTETEAEKQ
ncbi:uncharacterized protein MONOS_3815 [Monocercomonoides exilis]|uniref:uncharacterized protein n=1 Tax=Monocercomonoides exilis TaxID=2049356 RepID=UPI00355ACB64|nr:hypothetical protein MONOS_3815 [Monocercomonoides exilis]|eukprot:MONOS_3815.1-p1 / transcript=MONOS_3815.1 / gene=MONOS_3815 / organism=Monocercomonoides_exilis_PA203 / gene_product=unspecified product / transcript_product=unspecified product / location=Mono_scaffold00093:92956-93601(+) / protein_length=186 / sequence_SO=supercontig / SO=protein_coding / is_pseudo=false